MAATNPGATTPRGHGPNRLTATNGHATTAPPPAPVATAPASPVADDLAHDHARALVDVRYALRQLRQHRDVTRAIDALERVEAILTTAVG